MPKEINGQLFYSSTEICEKIGISRATLFRWLRKGLLKQLRKDRRGWRLFTEDDLISIQAEIEKIEIEERS
jgi:DNA-binding transcriptional MerR regulator